jgi:hypothetical protein
VALSKALHAFMVTLMDSAALKPKYFYLTEKIGFNLPVVWCFTSLAIGLFFKDIGGAIFISAMSLALTWLSFKLCGFFLSFQQHSGIASNSVFDKILKLIWLVSVIGFTFSILNAVFFKQPEHTYFYLLFSITYFGFSLAASKKWGSYYVETHAR